ncbi:hypothetical protein CDEF62S_01037 [Castellaniella defragrans]
MAERPALFGIQPAGALPLASRITDHELAVLPQVGPFQGPAHSVQRVPGSGDCDETDLQQGLAAETLGDAGADGQVRLAAQQRLVRPAQNGFLRLDPGRRAAGAEEGERLQQQPVREEAIDRQPQQGFAPRGELAGRRFQPLRVFHQQPGALQQDLPRGRGNGPAPLLPEDAQAQLILQPLDGIAHGRLALAQRLGRRRVATVIHHGKQCLPVGNRNDLIHI